MDELSISVIIAQIINFSLLFFLFYYLLGKKIVAIIEERRMQLAALDNSDSVVKEKIEAAEKEAKDIIEASRKEALSIQQNAEELSKNDTKQKLEQAESKAQSIVEAANRDIEKQRLSMLDMMRDKVLDLSLKINSKVFETKDSNKEFITKEVNSIKL